MEEKPEYDPVPKLNPSYGVTQSTSTGTVADPVPQAQLNPSYGFTSMGAVACCNSQDTTGVKVTAKKPARGCPCSWVSIGFVLVGVVACVSMAVAVWSIAKVHNISNSCEAWKKDSEIVGQANSDRIDELNATLISVINPEVPAGLLPSVPAISCLQVSLYPSGYYWVRASNGSAVRMYCDVTRSCGGVTGGWMRVVRLDFNDTSTSCPSGLREHVDSGIRTCGIESSEAACPSVIFSTSGVEYTKVCGKVIAYQDSTPDAFGSHGRGQDLTIDSNYVDGVSLTHGHTPRNHIWTFAAAIDEFGPDILLDTICECSHLARTGKPSPLFIGQDYFCESGSQDVTQDNRFVFRADDPLWDGAGCGSNSTCCSFNNPPWFHKELPSPTNDDIEMRVCSDEDRSNEDIAISSVEIYVQRRLSFFLFK